MLGWFGFAADSSIYAIFLTSCFYRRLKSSAPQTFSDRRHIVKSKSVIYGTVYLSKCNQIFHITRSIFYCAKNLSPLRLQLNPFMVWVGSIKCWVGLGWIRKNERTPMSTRCHTKYRLVPQMKHVDSALSRAGGCRHSSVNFFTLHKPNVTDVIYSATSGSRLTVRVDDFSALKELTDLTHDASV